MKYIANILTSYRIFGSILLLFFPVFSFNFYITYLLCGFSDMIDGIIVVPIAFDNILRGIEIHCRTCMHYRNIFRNSRRVLRYYG